MLSSSMRSLRALALSCVLAAPLCGSGLGAADFYALELSPGEDAQAVAQAVPGLQRWLALGPTLVVETATPPTGHAPRRLEVDPGTAFAIVLAKHHPLDEAHAPVRARFLARHAGIALAAVLPGPTPAAAESHLEVRPVPWNKVLVGPAHARVSRASDPATDAMVATVSADALKADVQKLVDFKTRHSLSQGYRDAADWCDAQLKSYGLTTSRVPFQMSGRTVENVVGELPGTGSTDVFIIGAHLDSIAFDNDSVLAPGADDNASGSACVLAIARAFRGKAPKATLRFMFYGGEEEDLLGSTAYLNGLAPEERARIKGVIILDMTAFHKGAPGLMLEGREISAPVTEVVAAAAARYTQLNVERSLEAWGSDHVPYLDEGIPALLTFELDYPVNGNQHSMRDRMELVDAEQAAAIARADVAALATLAGLAR